MDQTFRLPDGRETRNAEHFEREWKALYQPLEQVLGVRVFGFDPGLLVASADKPNTPAFIVPLWMARKILDFQGAARGGLP